MIYLDNASTTKMLPEVLDCMREIEEYYWGNRSSSHSFGFRVEQKLEESRKTISNLMDICTRSLYFTSGGTEANNLAIFGTCRRFHNKNRKLKIITSQIEHKSVINPYKYLENIGFHVSYLPVDKNGQINLEILESEINKDTLLVSMMHVNNETGAMQPIETIKKIIDSINSKILFHCDAVQGFGKIPKSISKYIDLMTVSAHKIHGPKGVGAIYIKNKSLIDPLIFGGDQESQIRSGTENISGIAGFSKAAEIAYKNINDNFDHVSLLKEKTIKLLNTEITKSEIISSNSYSPYILNLRIPNIKSETLINYLSENDIFISAGAACNSNAKTNGYVLKAMGYKNVDEHIRISFSFENNYSEIQKMIEFMKKNTNLSS